MDRINLSTVRQSFAQCVFNHKVHECAVEEKNKYSLWIKISNIVLVSLALIFVIIQIKNPTEIHISYIASSITIVEVLFLIIQLFFNFDNQAIQHKNSALSYLELRDEYKIFICDIINEIPKNSIISKRDLLQDKYKTITKLSPQTNSSNYKEAQKKLLGQTESDEQYTWSDKEIDRFLTDELKINNL